MNNHKEEFLTSFLDDRWNAIGVLIHPRGVREITSTKKLTAKVTSGSETKRSISSGKVV